MAGVRVVSDQDDIILVESGGVVIRMKAADVNRYRRDTQGVIVMRLEGETKVVSVERADPAEEEPESAEE